MMTFQGYAAFFTLVVCSTTTLPVVVTAVKGCNWSNSENPTCGEPNGFCDTRVEIPSVAPITPHPTFKNSSKKNRPTIAPTSTAVDGVCNCFPGQCNDEDDCQDMPPSMQHCLSETGVDPERLLCQGRCSACPTGFCTEDSDCGGRNSNTNCKRKKSQKSHKSCEKQCHCANDKCNTPQDCGVHDNFFDCENAPNVPYGFGIEQVCSGNCQCVSGACSDDNDCSVDKGVPADRSSCVPGSQGKCSGSCQCGQGKCLNDSDCNAGQGAEPGLTRCLIRKIDLGGDKVCPGKCSCPYLSCASKNDCKMFKRPTCRDGGGVNDTCPGTCRFGMSRRR